MSKYKLFDKCYSKHLKLQWKSANIKVYKSKYKFHFDEKKKINKPHKKNICTFKVYVIVLRNK